MLNNQKLKLIIGLGNPGPEYIGTRHNLGFMVLDDLAGKYQAVWQKKNQFKALVAEAQIGSQKIILAKPTTFYNLSGEAVQSLISFYKLDSKNLLTIHDELDLPFGTIRARTSGSDAGNKGIKNITMHIGTNFARIRIGIANDQLAHYSKEDFVLGRLSKGELDSWPLIIKRVFKLLDDFIQEDRIFEHTSLKM